MTAIALAYTPDHEIYAQINNLASRRSLPVTHILDALVREGMRHAVAEGQALFSGERRKFMRKASNIPAMVQTVDSKRTYIARAAMIHDISMGGVPITLAGETGQCTLGGMAHVELVFSLGDAEAPMVFTGRARRTDNQDGKCDMDMEFMDGSFKDYQTLAAYILQ